MTNGISTLADVLEIEKIPLAERNLPASTYQAIKQSAEHYHDQTALQFFLQGTAFKDARTFTYGEILAGIHQAANMFHDLGIDKDSVTR